MYPEEIVKPMKLDLLNNGFEELLTADQVNATLQSEGTVLLVVNSVCGCAGANARPAAKMALKNEATPDKAVTVFAGVDKEAVDAARALMLPFPPSSPCIALFKGGELVHIIERHHIEGRSAELIAENLVGALNTHC